MNTTAIIVCLIAVMASPLGFAASIDLRQENQRDRLVQGVASGELTGRETKRLVRQQRHIAATEARFKADGKFTLHERARIQHKQNKASGHIFRQKHDLQDRH